MAGRASHERAIAAAQSPQTRVQRVQDARLQDSTRREEAAEPFAVTGAGPAGKRNTMAGGPFAVRLRYLG